MYTINKVFREFSRRTINQVLSLFWRIRMNKFIKVLVLVAAALFSGSSFAQECIPAPYTMGQVQRCYDGRIITGLNGQRVYLTEAPRIIIVQRNNESTLSRLSECKLLGAGIGGALGNLSDENKGQKTVLGILAGIIVGDLICRNNEGERVQVRSVEERQALSRVRVPASCVVGGKDFGDIPESSCLKIRDALTTTTPSLTETRSEPRKLVREAYCPVTRTRDGVQEQKEVPNPSRTEKFCADLPKLLQSGEKKWEDL